MSNILTIDNTEGRTKELLTAAKSKFGMVPNLLGIMANAPSVLDTYMTTTGLLSEGVLPAQTREQLAIAIAAANNCEYCLSAHTAGGKASGVSTQDLASAQSGKASNAKTEAVLTLALALNQNHGVGSSKAVEAARKAGLNDAEILEVSAHVAINILTNTVNNTFGTVIDFPKTSLLNKAAA